MFGESTVWQKKVWRMNRSAKGLSMVGINLDGFSLANRLRFTKFAKLSPCQTFPLYGTHQENFHNSIFTKSTEVPQDLDVVRISQFYSSRIRTCL